MSRAGIAGILLLSYCSRYLAAVAVVAVTPRRSFATIGRPVNIGAGELSRVVPSHDSLEIRGSRHKSTDLSAPNGTIRPI